jgi:hypothetical protein
MSTTLEQIAEMVHLVYGPDHLRSQQHKFPALFRIVTILTVLLMDGLYLMLHNQTNGM